MFPEELTDFRTPLPPCPDKRVRVFQSDDQGDGSGQWLTPILHQALWEVLDL